MHSIREVTSADELRRCADGDSVLLWAAQGMAPGVRAWRRGDAVAVAAPFVACRDRLAVRGPADQVAALVVEVLRVVGPSFQLFGDDPLVAAVADRVPGLVYGGSWGWMEVGSSARAGSLNGTQPVTGPATLVAVAERAAPHQTSPHSRTPHPRTPHPATPDLAAPGPAPTRAVNARQDRHPAEVSRPARAPVEVRWLDQSWAGRIAELLDVAYPGSWVRPGMTAVRRWAGAFTPDGELAAVCADAWPAPEVGYVGGVATRPEWRGQGYAGAVFRFAVDALLTEHGQVTLMVDGANTAAVALYDRCGFRWRTVAAAGLRARRTA